MCGGSHVLNVAIILTLWEIPKFDYQKLINIKKTRKEVKRVEMQSKRKEKSENGKNKGDVKIRAKTLYLSKLKMVVRRMRLFLPIRQRLFLKKMRWVLAIGKF